jgi:lysine 2,3-aminomutase
MIEPALLEVETSPRDSLVWDDWRSQLRHSIKTIAELRQWINVTPTEEEAIQACSGKYRWSITPYYASLMDPDDPNCPIRRQAVPSPLELLPFPTASIDPVGDMDHRKTRRVVHKYPDRVIMLVTDACPVYCRHCTRKYHTTDLQGTYLGERAGPDWEKDFEYIEQTPQIRDVLLTGGDPLTLGDNTLAWIIRRLRQIPHVEIVRIGTRYPVLLPQRITPELCRILDQYQPIWLNTHFNHPKEITSEAAAACDRLLRHGVPVQNQTVLLEGINDDLEMMRKLVTGLLKIRVRPYYIYHCDNVTGVSHFATSIERGREIMRGLVGHSTGFAIPHYVLTTPLGKIPLWEDNLNRENGHIWIENYQGQRMDISDFVARPEEI